MQFQLTTPHPVLPVWLFLNAILHTQDNAACFFEKGGTTKNFCHRGEGVSVNPLKMENFHLCNKNLFSGTFEWSSPLKRCKKW